MKFKYVLYGLFAVAVLFAAATGYLFYSVRQSDSIKDIKPILQEAAVPSSQKAGKLAIFYTGDLVGNLDPCT